MCVFKMNNHGFKLLAVSFIGIVFCELFCCLSPSSPLSEDSQVLVLRGGLCARPSPESPEGQLLIDFFL